MPDIVPITSPFPLGLTGTGNPGIQVSTVTQGQGSTFQTVTFTGTNGGSVQFGYNGSLGSTATAVPFVPGSPPTAAQLQSHLDTIAELSGKVTVLGPNGGPLTVIFNGTGLAGTTASPLTMVGAGGSFALISRLLRHRLVCWPRQIRRSQSEVQTLTFGSIPNAAFTSR